MDEIFHLSLLRPARGISLRSTSITCLETTALSPWGLESAQKRTPTPVSLRVSPKVLRVKKYITGAVQGAGFR